MRTPLRVAITGAAGSIGKALLARIGAGAMFGHEQPVILQLIERPVAIDQLRGVAMELEDCAFPLVQAITLHDNPTSGFQGVHQAILIGSQPRTKGMERADLLLKNAEIFQEQGRALNDHANPNVRVLVVGNPCNTNTLIASRNAPNLRPEQFTALSRLDHNRLAGILGNHIGHNPANIKKLMVWGNHSASMVADIHHASCFGQPLSPLVDTDWYQNTLISKIQQRGAEIINTCGHSSTISAAHAIVGHMHDWANGTLGDDYTSMSVISDGSYGISEGIYFSFPVRCGFGRYQIVQDLTLNPLVTEMIKRTEQELLEEREQVKDMLPKESSATGSACQPHHGGELFLGCEQLNSKP